MWWLLIAYMLGQSDERRKTETDSGAPAIGDFAKSRLRGPLEQAPAEDDEQLPALGYSPLACVIEIVALATLAVIVGKQFGLW